MLNIQFARELKELTAPFHKSIESSKYPKLLLDSSCTREDYIEYLFKIYRFTSLVELRFYEYEDMFEDNKIDIESRCHSNKALSDLKNLGINTKSIEFENPKRIPKMDNFSKAFGILYLLEGSTMGGGVISSKLQNSGFATNALTYLKPYGESSMQKWSEFLYSFEKYASDKSVQTDIILSVCEGYLLLKEWFEQ